MNTEERDELITGIRIDVAEIKAHITQLPDHETRIRNLERFRFSFPSLAVLSILGTVGLGIASIFH